MTDNVNGKFVSPLARAKNFGSANEGVHHWLMERITAGVLVPLVFWLVFSILRLRGATYEEFTFWIQDPINASLMIMFILAGFYHAVMGLQVIIEDYISGHFCRMLKIILAKTIFAFMAIASIFSILKIAL